MKIAIFTSSFYPEVNGLSVALWERIKGLQHTNHEVLVFCPDYEHLSHIYPNWKTFNGTIFPNIKVINLPSKPFMGLQEHPTLAYASQSIIKKTLEAFQPDLIQADDIERMYFGVLFKDEAVKYAKKNKIPCVAMYHTNFLQYIEDYKETMLLLKVPFFEKFFKYNILRSYDKYDLVLVSSKVISNYLQSLGAKKIFYNEFLGVDLDLFHPEKRNQKILSEKYHISGMDDKIKVLNVGRLSADKGWDFLLSTLPEIAKTHQLENVVLVIVGYGDLEEEIKNKLSPYFNICFLGKLSHQEVAEVYASCDIFLTGSEKESKGLTVLEASAAGIPVLAPRAGGIIDSVIEGETGYLYDPKNKEDFSHRFLKLIYERDLAQQMGKAGRSAMKNFSWKKAFENWISVITNL